MGSTLGTCAFTDGTTILFCLGKAGGGTGVGAGRAFEVAVALSASAVSRLR